MHYLRFYKYVVIVIHTKCNKNCHSTLKIVANLYSHFYALYIYIA